MFLLIFCQLFYASLRAEYISGEDNHVSSKLMRDVSMIHPSQHGTDRVAMPEHKYLVAWTEAVLPIAKAAFCPAFGREGDLLTPVS